MNRRIFIQASGALLFASQVPRSLFGQPLAGSLQGPTTVGASLPLSGDAAAHGQELYRVLSAVLTGNRGAELRVLDDGGSLKQARQNYRALAQEGADFFVGVLGEERSRALEEVAREYRSVSGFVVGCSPRGKTAPGVLNLRPELSVEADRIAKSVQDAALGRVGLLYSLDASGRRYRDALVAAFDRLRIEVVAEASSRPGGFSEREPRNLASELRSRGADVIVSAEGGVATSRFMSVSRDFGWAVPLICTSNCDLVPLWEALSGGAAGSSARGLLVVRSIGTGDEANDSMVGQYRIAREANLPPSATVEQLPLGPAKEFGLEAFLQAVAVERALTAGSDLVTTTPSGSAFAELKKGVWDLGPRGQAQRLQGGGSSLTPRGYRVERGLWTPVSDWGRVLSS